eukprot:Nk52_evm110s352 gene=Nk52_evmTU110s352
MGLMRMSSRRSGPRLWTILLFGILALVYVIVAVNGEGKKGQPVGFLVVEGTQGNAGKLVPENGIAVMGGAAEVKDRSDTFKYKRDDGDEEEKKKIEKQNPEEDSASKRNGDEKSDSITEGTTEENKGKDVGGDDTGDGDNPSKDDAKKDKSTEGDDKASEDSGTKTKGEEPPSYKTCIDEGTCTFCESLGTCEACSSLQIKTHSYCRKTGYKMSIRCPQKDTEEKLDTWQSCPRNPEFDRRDFWSFEFINGVILVGSTLVVYQRKQQMDLRAYKRLQQQLGEV